MVEIEAVAHRCSSKKKGVLKNFAKLTRKHSDTLILVL